MTSRVKWLLMVVLAIGALGLAAACGDDDDDTNADAAATEEAAHDDEATDGVAFEMDAETVLHHWQALAAIADGNLDDARHHIEHIIGVVDADADHASAMREALAALDAGELHDAEHGIELMVAGSAETELTTGQLHLQMALTALTAREDADARHHIEHAVAALHDDEAAELDAVIAFLDEGDHDEAAEHLTELVIALSGGAEHEDDADHEAGSAELEADREIIVVMTEFAYEPAVIHAKVGERVRLVLHNEGVVLHDITAEEFHGQVTTTGSLEQHESTAGGHDAGANVFHAALNGGDSAELVFEAEEAGEYTLFCTVPGHRELGMTATLIVEP